MTALLLLMPGTPMLFQGQEMASSRPFLYFADHRPEIAAAVQRGRAEFVAQFPSLAAEPMQARLAIRTIERHSNGASSTGTNARRMRRYIACTTIFSSCAATDAAIRRQAPGTLDGAVIGPLAFVLRFAASRTTTSGCWW